MRAGLEEQNFLGIFQNGYSPLPPPPPPASHSLPEALAMWGGGAVFFLSYLHSENLVGLLEIKFINVWDPPPSQDWIPWSF